MIQHIVSKAFRSFSWLGIAVGAGFFALAMLPSSCRMAPKDNPGDTVAASVFAPPDTAAINRKARLAKKNAPVKDSADIFYIGDGSTRHELQLVSYPSKRDTVVYGKARHMKKSGNADYGRAVRVRLWMTSKGDTLVQAVEELVGQGGGIDKKGDFRHP